MAEALNANEIRRVTLAAKGSLRSLQVRMLGLAPYSSVFCTVGFD